MSFKKGFSLLELVLAVAIFSMFSIGLGYMLIDSNLTTRLAGERILALLHAKESIDAVQSIGENDWGALTEGDHGLGFVADTWSFSGESDMIDSDPNLDDDKYTRVINIANTATSTMTVTVTISWSVTDTRSAEVALTTLITNWRD